MRLPSIYEPCRDRPSRPCSPGGRVRPPPPTSGTSTDGPALPTQPNHPDVPPAELDVDLTSDAPGPLLATGTVADVFALDDRRVLRRDRSGRDQSGEAEIVRHVIAHGFP